MNIYFVRHGQSILNAVKIHQTARTPLSDVGKQQATSLANRFKRIPIDVIISSPYKRAKETAEIISNVVNVPVEYSDLLTELRRPTAVHEKPSDDPEVRKILDLIIENIEDKDWRHSDEEGFDEFKQRALNFLSFLHQRKEENILVVTHGTLMKMIIATMMFGETINAEEFLRWIRFFAIKNTGLTLCKLEEGNWSLTTWNDHAHLG